MKKMQTTDVYTLIAPYPGKWVALNQDETEVLGTGNSIEIVVQAAQNKGEGHPVIIKSPDKYSVCLL